MHFADVVDHAEFDLRRLEAALGPDDVTLRGLALYVVSERTKKQSRRVVLHALPSAIDVFASGRNLVLRASRTTATKENGQQRTKQRRRKRRPGQTAASPVQQSAAMDRPVQKSVAVLTPASQVQKPVGARTPPELLERCHPPAVVSSSLQCLGSGSGAVARSAPCGTHVEGRRAASCTGSGDLRCPEAQEAFPSGFPSPGGGYGGDATNSNGPDRSARESRPSQSRHGPILAQHGVANRRTARGRPGPDPNVAIDGVRLVPVSTQFRTAQ